MEAHDSGHFSSEPGQSYAEHALINTKRDEKSPASHLPQWVRKHQAAYFVRGGLARLLWGIKAHYLHETPIKKIYHIIMH